MTSGSEEWINPGAIAAARETVGIVKHFVDHPDEVRVEIREGAMRVTVELYTHPRDVGQVIGRNGHLSTSLRAFLSAIAGRHKTRIDFDYVTEEENKRRQERARTTA
jgi:predicted RNA-binding protein YlqC (UPF0109 family)